MSSPQKLWTQLAKDYSQATGIDCRVLTLSDSVGHICPICGSFREEYGIDTDCSRLHSFSAYQSEHWGGRYIYLCPLSGLYWSSPLITDGMMAGALIAGPALLGGIDHYFLSTVKQRYGLNRENEKSLDTLYSHIPLITPEKAKSLSEVLFSMALSGSDRHDLSFFDNRESYQHESRIGEYIHLLKSMEGDKNSDIDYPLDLEKKLLESVSRGEKNKANLILDKLIAMVMYSTGVNINIIRSRIMELVVLLSRAALEGGADLEQIFGLNYSFLNSIRNCQSTEEMTSWLRRIINRFGDLVFDLKQVKHTGTILQSLKFIRENFYERITLSDVASHIGLTPDYFGKLFKKELSTSFSDYLSGLRIEEAKRLLKSGSASMGDIAYACGFEDQSYFTKVFKKAVGVTPSQYREKSDYYLNQNHSVPV